MGGSFRSICDEFFVSGRLFLKLDLPMNRETVLYFFDRIRRQYPALRRLRRRDDESLVLEESNQPDGSRRWIRLEGTCLRFGHLNPPDLEDVKHFGQALLHQAPYYLSLSELELDHLEVVFGFDLEYEGNHDQLVAETLFADHPICGFLLGGEACHVIDCQPFWGISLNRSCDVQAYIELKSRTTTYEVRTAEYEAQALSVYLTTRRYWAFSPGKSPDESFVELLELGGSLAAEKVVPLVVVPLAQAIASRS